MKNFLFAIGLVFSVVVVSLCQLRLGFSGNRKAIGWMHLLNMFFLEIVPLFVVVVGVTIVFASLVMDATRQTAKKRRHKFIIE